MALRIRKSIKIAPGVRINISKSGVSTSLGVKGATVNLSKRGTRVTTGIPGTGISSSKFYGGRKERGYPYATYTGVGACGHLANYCSSSLVDIQLRSTRSPNVFGALK